MLQISNNKIEAFCHRWKVAELALFGSALREDFSADSDVDILISFINEARWSLFDLLQMKGELETIFARSVDLIEKKALRNPFRRHSILLGREVIYATG